ncbi:hypothetical protein BRADI_1g78766v3 [Brachypodium distachyon]|uniref:Uncharacterized protein n=1 Tax=Brachypodium distachyon TaxID=15368 RepID=A0A0Q3HMW7_BRADI|nr:hypothetical protein BRADI_1g78766v3 [Brachypodium distachyon]
MACVAAAPSVLSRFPLFISPKSAGRAVRGNGDVRPLGFRAVAIVAGGRVAGNLMCAVVVGCVLSAVVVSAAEFVAVGTRPAGGEVLVKLRRPPIAAGVEGLLGGDGRSKGLSCRVFWRWNQFCECQWIQHPIYLVTMTQMVMMGLMKKIIHCQLLMIPWTMSTLYVLLRQLMTAHF